MKIQVKIVTCKAVLFSIMLLLSVTISAQEMKGEIMKVNRDSIRGVYMDQYALKNPLARQVVFSSEVISRKDFSNRLYGKDFIKGDAQIIRTKAIVKMPVVNWGRNSIGSGIGVFHQHIELSNIQNYNDQLQVENIGFNTTSTNLALDYNRHGTLFNKPVLLHVGVNESFNASFRQTQFSAMTLLLFDIKRTANTSLSIGGVILISPRPIFPCFTLINYTHQFQSAKLELIASLPYSIRLRKELSEKSFVSFVSELGGYNDFYEFSNNYLPRRGQFSQLEVKSGILYEYRVSKKIIVGVNGGLLYSGKSKMYDANNYFSKSYSIKSNASLDPYLNVNVSLLTLAKGFSK